MGEARIPLREISIEQLYFSSEGITYEVPIYQRNYAWGKDEIGTLVQDVYDAFRKAEATEGAAEEHPYYIGTLVTFRKGDGTYEVIDGQQRLTTIFLLLHALGARPSNRLTYCARKKADATIKNIPEFAKDEIDDSIAGGFDHACKSIDEIVPKDERENFSGYFKNAVHLIHYMVPKDIDLNHYFEIMNSRGEQLEKHEIVKARLLGMLQNQADRHRFSLVWDACSEMSVYIQQQYKLEDWRDVPGWDDFSRLLERSDGADDDDETVTPKSIGAILDSNASYAFEEQRELPDRFQPIINFSNFLLIVLKLMRVHERDLCSSSSDSADHEPFILDDKELINEFDKAGLNEERIKKFALWLLKARYYLDNYIVHHRNEEDTVGDNPWVLKKWQRNEKSEKAEYVNLCGGTDEEVSNLQQKLVQLLSMFEVSFTARQRKNYLFYCLLYLLQKSTSSEDAQLIAYCEFVEELADKYFFAVYMNQGNLNDRNTPLPGSFDRALLKDGRLNVKYEYPLDSFKENFRTIYGDGQQACKGMPLFIFNYLDFKIWKLYTNEIRGERGERKKGRFFEERLGCSNFGLDFFRHFYFSRTRRSLEHYYPQANVRNEESNLNENQINCLGNYAMIGSAANSMGSNWPPSAKIEHYLNKSGKIDPVSVASLKFRIMMQKCADNREKKSSDLAWDYGDIREHQEKMLDIIMSEVNVQSEANVR